MRRSCAWLSLPEHPREQDCVTRPLPSLFRLRPLPTPVASCQLPERPLTGQAVCARAERAKSERRKANSDEFKSLFWNILPITPTGSIFCGESFLIAFCFQYFAPDRGRGVPVSCPCQQSVASCQWSVARRTAVAAATGWSTASAVHLVSPDDSGFSR